jgi:hypothetical protein
MTNALRYDLVLDPTKWVKGFAEGERASARFGETTAKVSQSSAKHVEESAGRLHQLGSRIAAAGAVVAGVEFFKSTIEQGREANLQLRITEAAIKSTGDASGMTAEGIHKLAEKFGEADGVMPSVVQSSENMLLSFKEIGSDVFPKAEGAVLDLATGMGKGTLTSEGMQAASVALGKALDDPAKGLLALHRVGVDFSDQQKQQITQWVKHGETAKAQGAILAEVETEFGGRAEAAATSSGKLHVKLSEVQEEMGQKLIPILDRGASVVLSLVDAFERHERVLGPLVGGVAALAGVIGTAAAAHKIYKIAEEGVTAATTVLKVAQAGLNVVMDANPVILVAGGVVLLGAALYEAYRHVKPFHDAVDTTFRDVKKGVGGAVDFAIDAFKGFFDAGFSTVEGILHVFGKLPGPMGAPFRSAEKSVQHARATVDGELDRIQRKVDSLTGKDIDVRAHDKVKPTIALIAAELKQSGWSPTARMAAGRMQRGGRLAGYGGGDVVPLWAEPGEAVVPKEAAKRPEFAAWAGAMGIPGFQHGGLVRLPTSPLWMNLVADKQTILAGMGGAVGGFGGGAASGTVISLALAQAKRMAASYKVALALIEAGIVESGLRNLPYGDRDSLGFLQQRPSQGWAHPMDVSYAAYDFLRRAIGIQGRYGTAGALAQAVQRSAFPLRYDQQQARAMGILGAYGYDRGGWLPPGVSLAVNNTGRPEPVGGGGVTVVVNVAGSLIGGSPQQVARALEPHIKAAMTHNTRLR